MPSSREVQGLVPPSNLGASGAAPKEDVKVPNEKPAAEADPETGGDHGSASLRPEKSELLEGLVAVVDGSSSNCSSSRSLSPDKKDKETEPEIKFHDLEKDTYNILFTADPRSLAFGFGMVIFIMQATILVLMMADMLDDDTRIQYTSGSRNKLEVPTHVTTTVSLAQFLAIILSVASQTDVITSLYDLVVLKYDEKILETNPHATVNSWYFSLGCRFLQGAACMVVSFFFIVQSSTVLQIFGSFAAVSFVSEIDNLAFTLASRGYLHRDLEAATVTVEHTKLPQRPRSTHNYQLRLLFMACLYLIIGGSWAFVRSRQNRDIYLRNRACPLFKVNFGTEYFKVYNGYVPKSLNGTIREYASDRFTVPEDGDVGQLPVFYYSYFNGIYTPVYDRKGRIMTKENRPVYVENLRFLNDTFLEMENGFADPTRGRFFYCWPTRRWVFAVLKVYDAEANCAKDWMLQSPVTEAYTLEEVSPAGWQIWTGRFTVTEAFSYVCDNCGRFEAGSADCNYAKDATCDRNKGVCDCGDGGWLGSRCTIEPACPDVVFAKYGSDAVHYRETEGYQALIDENTGRVLTAYERPIYTLTRENITNGDRAVALHGLSNDDIEILVFTGNRWFNGIYSSENFRKVFLEATAPFHAYWDGIGNMPTKYFSDPIDPTAPFSGSPTRVQWNYMPPSKSVGDYAPFTNSHYAAESEVAFNCHGLCRHNLCGEHGECGGAEEGVGAEDGIANRTCVCRDCWGGYFCEIAPDMAYVQGAPAYYESGPFASEPSDYHRLFWQPQSGNGATCLAQANAPYPLP